MRLILVLLIAPLTLFAADFGDIPRTLVLGAGQSVRRNAGDTLFEAYTPGTGTLNATLVIHSSGDSTDSSTITAANSGLKQVDINNVEMLRLWSNGQQEALVLGYNLPAGLINGGPGNTFIGANIAINVGSSSGNSTAVGTEALRDLTSGFSNTVLGYHAGQSLQTGDSNVVVGDTADILEPSGQGITLVGSQIDAGSGVTSDAFALGANITITSNHSGVLGYKTVTDIYAGFDDFDSSVHATIHALGYTGNGSQLTNIPGADIWADGGGTPIGASTTSPVISQSTFTITKWKVVCDTTCSVTIDVKRAADGAGLPVTSIVGGGTKPSISTAVESSISAPVGWTSTDITEGDKLAITFSSISGNPTHISLVLYR